MHSDWSDGSQTLEEIIETGLVARLHAFGRHRSFVWVADRRRTVDGARRAAASEIDALNAKYRGRFRLLKGIEANIRADGRWT